MESQVNQIDPVTVEVQVQVPWDRVEEGLRAGYGKLRKTVQVRGFRRGKVPRNVLKRLYGPQVDGEVVANLVEESLLAAVETHELAVVASPTIEDLPKITKGEPLSFKAKVEVRPKVEEVVLEGLKVERPPVEVNDEDVEQAIERYRREQADIVTPEEARPSREGDLLTLDYVVEVDGELRPEMETRGRTVELGLGRLLPELEEGLIGREVGSVTEIRVPFGEDAPSEELRNRRALFRVTIRELRERRIPALDDDFAQELGSESVDALRRETRETLEEDARKVSKRSVREQIIRQLVEKNPIPVPPSLVEQQAQQMERDLAFLRQFAPNLDLGGETPVRERAERKVRAGILLGELARREGLEVGPEEIEAKLQQIAESTGKHIAKVRVEYAGEKRDALANELLEDKLLDFLLSRATVTDAKVGEDAADEEGQDR